MLYPEWFRRVGSRTSLGLFCCTMLCMQYKLVTRQEKWGTSNCKQWVYAEVGNHFRTIQFSPISILQIMLHFFLNMFIEFSVIFMIHSLHSSHLVLRSMHCFYIIRLEHLIHIAWNLAVNYIKRLHRRKHLCMLPVIFCWCRWSAHTYNIFW